MSQTDTITTALKGAIRIYAAQSEHTRAKEEENELKIIEKILRGESMGHTDSEEEKDGDQRDDNLTPQAEHLNQQEMFEKIVQKLMEYNDKINNGKEISVVEYLKRLDQKSIFIQKFHN